MDVVDMIIEAYIEVMGEEKWNSLTADEQHAVIMTFAAELYDRMDKEA